MKFTLVVLTYNGGTLLQKCIDSMDAIPPDSILIIDSKSSDNSLAKSISLGYRVHQIPQSEFNHGATRQLALTLCPDSDIFIYMTQDAILASPDSISTMLKPFADAKVGAVCGRQLPHADASPLAFHARTFNYAAVSSIKSLDDVATLGIKAAFISNSFAAYRRTALLEVGGFPCDAILSEDTFVVAKMLQKGWKLAYAAEATCYHSHNYSIWQEFQRYFDIGVFHGREPWYLSFLGHAEGEGKRFVLSEMHFLWRRAPWLIPSALVRTACKLLGYRLGQQERHIPPGVKRRLSMNKGFWKDK
jgi:rhamnosyltransferase